MKSMAKLSCSKGHFENVVVVPLVESERKPRDDEIEMIKDFLEDR